MQQSEQVFSEQYVHDIGCRCRSCLSMSAYKRVALVFSLVLLLWVVVFMAMGWSPSQFF